MPFYLALVLSSRFAPALAQQRPAHPLVARETSHELTFNVRDFGARGDGNADDQPAITRTVEKLSARGKGMLYFPHGVYRCARQARQQDGVLLSGVSDVSIVFEPGAVLLMDNLNPKDGRGDYGHGIRLKGPCSNIWLENVVVKWRQKPSRRSMGDGFRFEGHPTDEKTIANIRFINCKAEQCPQAGAVFMGCSDICVRDFAVWDNLADGLHFNACRRIDLNGLAGINTGDDALAFVTYYDFEKPENLYAYGNPSSGGPYNQPALSEWSNTHSNATNVVRGGRANGVRFAGAHHINLSNVTVEGKTCAVTLDCGRKQRPRFGWGYLASRHINITNLTARGSAVGLFVWNFNMSFEDDPKWWRFEINAQNIVAEDCRHDSVHLWRCAGVSIRGVKALNRQIRVHDVMDCSLDHVDLRNGALFIQGEPKPPARAADMRWANVHLGRASITRSYSTMPATSSCSRV